MPRQITNGSTALFMACAVIRICVINRMSMTSYGIEHFTNRIFLSLGPFVCIQRRKGVECKRLGKRVTYLPLVEERDEDLIRLIRI